MQTIGQGCGYLKPNRFFLENGIYLRRQRLILYFQGQNGDFLINLFNRKQIIQ